MARSLVLTVEESGELLGISRALAYDLVRRGTIPSLRLGRRIVVPRHALSVLLGLDSIDNLPADHATGGARVGPESTEGAGSFS